MDVGGKTIDKDVDDIERRAVEDALKKSLEQTKSSSRTGVDWQCIGEEVGD